MTLLSCPEGVAVSGEDCIELGTSHFTDRGPSYVPENTEPKEGKWSGCEGKEQCHYGVWLKVTVANVLGCNPCTKVLRISRQFRQNIRREFHATIK